MRGAIVPKLGCRMTAGLLRFNPPPTRLLKDVAAPRVFAGKLSSSRRALTPKQYFSGNVSSSSPSLWARARTKLGHIRSFFTSYLSGAGLFASEMRVATRLAWRVYGQGKRSSRQERIHMRQSLGDLVRVIPLAGLFVVFGLELSTAAILRYMPNLLPRAMRQAIVPAAQKLGVAPTSNAAAAARRRLALCTDLVQGSRAVAEASNLGET